MKTILTACALFVCSLCSQAYELVATVSAWDETRWHFDIELANNDIDFTAFQMNITIDGDATLRRDSITCGSLMVAHNLMLCKPSGLYCVAGYNMGNEVLAEKEGPLLSFTIVGDIKGVTIDGITFVKTDSKSVAPDVTPNVKDGDKKAPAAQKENEVVFNLRDKKTWRIDRRGIIIHNGEKAEK